MTVNFNIRWRESSQWQTRREAEAAKRRRTGKVRGRGRKRKKNRKKKNSLKPSPKNEDSQGPVWINLEIQFPLTSKVDKSLWLSGNGANHVETDFRTSKTIKCLHNCEMIENLLFPPRVSFLGSLCLKSTTIYFTRNTFLAWNMVWVEGGIIQTN